MSRVILRRIGRIAAFFVAGLLLLCVIGVIFSWRHWWWRVFSCTIYVGGVQCPNARIYFQSDETLICIPDSKHRNLFLCYIVQPQGNNIDVCGGSGLSFSIPAAFLLLPGAAFATNVPPDTTPMNTAEVDTNPNLVRRNGTLQFNGIGDDHDVPILVRLKGHKT